MIGNVRVDVGMAAAFHPDLQFVDVVQCPKNWVASGGAAGFRVPVVVTAVCVAAAVAHSVNGAVVVAGVNVERANDHATFRIR